MSERADRMRRQLAGGATEASRPVAPPRFYPRRITLDLTAEDHQALRLAVVQHDTTMADLLRDLVAHWRADTGPRPAPLPGAPEALRHRAQKYRAECRDTEVRSYRRTELLARDVPSATRHAR